MASPVLKQVPCNSTNFSFSPALVDRGAAEPCGAGRLDCLVLGLFVMAHFKGQVIVPDFGFYGRESHVSLIREGRLIAGVNFLDELSDKPRKAALLIEDRVGMGATADDAEMLAKYAGLRPDRLREDNEYNRFIDETMA